jgi:hypothetical protein
MQSSFDCSWLESTELSPPEKTIARSFRQVGLTLFSIDLVRTVISTEKNVMRALTSIFVRRGYC